MNSDDNLEIIKKAISSIESKIDSQNKRLAELEKIVINKEIVENKDEQIKEALEAVAEENEKQEVELKKIETNNGLKESGDKQAGMNIEEAIGGKLFAKIGIVALIVGVSLFLKYAFENWWGPGEKVATGLIIGLILLIIGEKTIKKYSHYGQMLDGGSMVVFYLSIFSAFNFYNLIPQFPAMVIMIIITALSVFLSIKHNARYIMLLSILGGFATPFLVSSGENNYVGLFSYVILLDMAIMAIGFFNNWKENNYLGFAGTFIVYGLWSSRFYNEELIFPAMVFLTTFFVIYSISLVAYNLIKKEKTKIADNAIAMAVALSYFGVGYNLMNVNYHDYMGIFSFALSLYYFVGGYVMYKFSPTDKLRDFFAILSSFFLATGLLIQFDNYIITISWAIEAVLISYIGIRHKNETFKIIGLVLLILTIFRNVIFDHFLYIENSMIFLNEVFLTSVFVALSIYLISFLFLKYQEEDRADKSIFMPTLNTVAAFMVIANIFTIFAIDREIIVYYSYRLSGGLDVENMRDFFLNLSWLVYGFILVLSGFVKRFNSTKIIGLILVFLAITQSILYNILNFPSSLRLIIGLTTIAIAYSLTYLYGKLGRGEEKKLSAIFGALANFVTILLVSKEINEYYKDKNLLSRGSIALSIFWLIYGIGLTAIGIIFKKRALRIGAILLLLIAILKLFLYDLWYLGSLYRIISSICLSLVLLSISFVYQKYADKIKEVI